MALLALIAVTALSPGGNLASDPIGETALNGSALDFEAERTIGHALLYALLGFATAVRFAVSDVARRSPWRALIMIVLAIWVLAASTELAQEWWVDGRGGEIEDWLADMVGALLGLAGAGPAMRAVIALRRR